MTQSDLVESSKSMLCRGVAMASELLVSHAQGAYVYMENDPEGYLDFTSGIGVVNTGHCHPKVVKAAQKQAGEISHAQMNMFYQRPMLELMNQLKRVMPHPSLDTFFFWNSGSEAVEAAIKLARHATGKPNVIVFSGGHHGRTFGTMSLTSSKTIFSGGFGPMMPGVYTVPFPDALHCSARNLSGHTPEHCALDTMQQLELLMKQRTPPQDTAAVLIEPVLGEGGYIPVPTGFLTMLRKFCNQNNVLLIADEVQTGFGRTGKMFAVEHTPDATPDILVMAKGIASGYPLSAIASSRALMDKQPPGSMGGTFSGNAVSCAAAVATLQVFEEEALLKNATVRSQEFFKILHAQLPAILPPTIKADIRGIGLMIGIEFVGAPSGFAQKVISAARENHKFLLLTASVYETLRLIPPLTVTSAQVEDGICRLLASIQDVL
ncbi:pyridoxal phosphate-dependent transferase [Syncephalastrum racemosum]|uniref:Pyridoxal phosphate-dependent transferase n=1 Tax=Syncephalastrum racemosum TaxID=13706 RepID=A0A1X2HLP4_SYNRA|nr:pyridoxal phosphate-dependent transferase [Syncephalastrum racemosum]